MQVTTAGRRQGVTLARCGDAGEGFRSRPVATGWRRAQRRRNHVVCSNHRRAGVGLRQCSLRVFALALKLCVPRQNFAILCLVRTALHRPGHTPCPQNSHLCDPYHNGRMADRGHVLGTSTRGAFPVFPASSAPTGSLHDFVEQRFAGRAVASTRLRDAFEAEAEGRRPLSAVTALGRRTACADLGGDDESQVSGESRLRTGIVRTALRRWQPLHVQPLSLQGPVCAIV